MVLSLSSHHLYPASPFSLQWPVRPFKTPLGTGRDGTYLLIPALKRHRQEDSCAFETSLVYFDISFGKVHN